MSDSPAPRARLAEFDALRAVAIVSVVLAHSVVARPQFPPLLRNVIAGGTCVFVFISGFFFRQVFYGRVGPAAFWWKRTKALVPPFLCMSALGLFFDLVGRALRLDNPWPSFWAATQHAAVRGYILHPHWYVPFALLLFAFAPLYAKFIRLRLTYQLTLLGAASVLGALAHRPLHQGSGWHIAAHSVAYFMPFYLLGILVAEHRAKLRAWRGRAVPLCALWWASALVYQTYWTFHHGNSHKLFWQYRGLDPILLQKLPQCILLLFACEALTRRGLPPGLRTLSEASFAVFFLHSFFCDELVRQATRVSTAPLWTVPATVAVTVLGLGASLFVAYLLRRTTRASRWIVGW